jgi:hypothetical protein
MSRSYRKPYCTDGYKGSLRKQFFKREANKKIRNSEEVPDGKAYRKFYDPWNICDYHYFVPKENLEKWWPEWWKLIRK